MIERYFDQSLFSLQLLELTDWEDVEDELTITVCTVAFGATNSFKTSGDCINLGKMGAPQSRYSFWVLEHIVHVVAFWVRLE